MDYARRQRALAAELERHRLDALLVTHLASIRYLCGFTGSAGVLLANSGRPLLFTDGRYKGQAPEEATTARVIIAKGSPLAAAAQWAGSHRMKALGFEADHIRVSTFDALRRSADNKTRLRKTSGIVERLRLVKDAAEIDLIRQAVDLGSSLLDVALASIRPGVAEMEVAAAMEYEARRRGAEGMSFETIVASGPRSALPHGRASQALVPARGFVVLDFGVILHGYCSDMTRTVHVGKMSAAERNQYGAVREAQQAAIEAVHAGATCGEVDRAARSLLRRAGLARYFSHSTGHGVGLEIHEPPRLARNLADRLEPGMVITIEPGVYVPERGGVRIEDMVVVRDRGCEVLTRAPKDLIVL